MHVLEKDFLLPSYDVVVVGSGIGGLTAAALLAKRGLKVLVIEQHYIPGGCASIFRRKGFTFDVGASLFFGFGEHGYNPHQFVMNELEEDITLIQMDETFTIHLDKFKKISMYTNREKFWNELCNSFPHESRQIKLLLTEFESFYTESLDSYGGQFFAPAETPPDHGKNLLFKKPLYLIRLLRYLLSTQEQLFRRFIKDPQILKLFTLLNQNMTTCDLNQTPAIAGPMIHVESYTGGCYYAYGSPQVLANKLEKAIYKYGGKIIYRQRVKEILIEDGIAIGCQLQNGINIYAKTVVSNATIWNLYGKLIDKKNIPQKRKMWAQNFKPSSSIFAVYIGVNSKIIPKNTKPTQILSYIDEGTQSYLTVYITSLLDPESSPLGTHTMCIFLPESTPTNPSPTDGKDKYQNKFYRKNKEDKAEVIIDYLDQNYFTGLKENILVKEIATPYTIQRYTLKNAGAIGGPQVNMRQSYMSRLAAKSEWDGLYCVGDSTSQGIGVVSVTVSAISAVNAILKDLKKEEYRPLKKYPKSFVHIINHDLGDTQDLSTEQDLSNIYKSHLTSKKNCLSPRCINTCPDSSDNARIARLVESCNWIGASQVIRDLNPLSEITGYLSCLDDFCSDNCARQLCPDASLRVKSLSRYICEQIPFYKPDIAPLNNHKIVIVGAGPTGLTCAHYLARLGYIVDIYERSNVLGGKMRWVTTTSRVPEEVISREISSLILPSISVFYNKTLGLDISIDELKDSYDYVFLACGAESVPLPNFDKNHVKNSINGIAFIDSLNKGNEFVSANTYTVIGNTMMANDIAEFLISSGALVVNLIPGHKSKDSKLNQARLFQLQEKGVYLLETTNDLDINKLASISQKVIFANEASQTIGENLINHLSIQLDFNKEDWYDTKNMFIKGQNKVLAGGEMTEASISFTDSIKDGRRAAALIHQEY